MIANHFESPLGREKQGTKANSSLALFQFYSELAIFFSVTSLEKSFLAFRYGPFQNSGFGRLKKLSCFRTYLHDTYLICQIIDEPPAMQSEVHLIYFKNACSCSPVRECSLCVGNFWFSSRSVFASGKGWGGEHIVYWPSNHPRQ